MADKKIIQNDYDVLIVGAGPCGLTLGLQLARYGVKFQIIDKQPALPTHSLSYALQASTLETLSNLGVGEGLMQLGVAVRKVNAYINGKPSFDIDFRQTPPSPFPFMLTVDQANIEKMLAATLQQQGSHISWNAELQSLKQSKTGVTAEIIQDGKKITTTASWVVGCDGGDSAVRNVLNIPLQGNTYKEKFIVADLAIDWGLAKNESHVFLHPSDLFMATPLPNGLYRVITTQDGIEHKGEITVKDLLFKFQKLVPAQGVLTNPVWMKAFEVQRRLAPQLRVNRVFLAGDAAHVHSPIGSQGLNTGIQDAYNLGWKLGFHVNGLANDKLLDSYQSERLDVSKAVLANTNMAMNIVMTHSRLGQMVRDVIAPLILNYPAAQKQLKRIIADTPFSYRNSPAMYSEKEAGVAFARKIKEAFLGGVNIGDHAPNFDLMQPKDFKRFSLMKFLPTPKHIILVMLGDKSKEQTASYETFSHIKKVLSDFAESYFIVGEHAIDYTKFDQNVTDAFIDPDGRGHQIYRCIEPTLYLLRPDGYVSYKGPLNIDILREYLDKYFDLMKPKLDRQNEKNKAVDMAV